MNNSILELQKKFVLFQVGDKRQGVVVSEINGEKQVKLQGGVFGFISASSSDFYQRNGIVLSAGKSLEFEVSEIKEGIPYLTLPATYIFANSYHPARVRFSGTQGIVVEFDWDKALNVGFYCPKLGLPEELTTLEENARVLCKGLTPKQDFYQIESLQIDDCEPEEDDKVAEETLREFDMPESWSDNEAKNYVCEHGGFLSKGAYKVGECYVATVINGFSIQFKDGSRAVIKKKAESSLQQIEGDNIVVRVLRIYDFGDMKEVELLDIVSDEYVRLFTKKQNKNLLPECVDAKQKNRHTYIDSGFVFGQRDDVIFNEGKNSGSEINYERYWLGFLYIAKIQNRQAQLPDNLGNPIEIELLENPDYGTLSDEDVAFVRLHYIKKEGNKVIMTMRVEFVRARKSSDENLFVGK